MQDDSDIEIFFESHVLLEDYYLRFILKQLFTY